MKSLRIILLFTIFAGCASTGPGDSNNPLAGTWKYVRCNIKNTSVNGTITFRTNGTFELDADARDDYPVGSIRGVYSYKINGPMILTDYTKGYGISLYYFIKDDELFFSDNPPVDNNEKTGWDYKLWRVR